MHAYADARVWIRCIHTRLDSLLANTSGDARYCDVLSNVVMCARVGMCERVVSCTLTLHIRAVNELVRKLGPLKAFPDKASSNII